MSRRFVSIASMLYLSGLVTATIVTAEEQRKPNIIFLLADDLGWTGLRCYGSDLHRTPHLDQLAADGMKFTDAYSACTVCSPTRASIMTGKYPARLHLTDFIAGQNRPFAKLRIPDWTKRLELEEVTIAEALKSNGYATAHVGKWHLAPRGNEARQYDPQSQGFDVSIVKPPGTRGYFIPERLREQGKVKSLYLTDHLTDGAVKIVNQWKDKPFFLYFAYHTPHTPIQGKRELIDLYSKSVDGDHQHTNPTYAAMVHSLDESVGRILAAVDNAGIADDTIVIFTSDNGGLTQRFGKPTGFITNAPLRRGKGSAYEGGVRVPLIVKWPGKTKAGTVCDESVSTVDFYPTLLDLTSSKGVAAHNKNVDGKSLVGLLQDADSTLQRDALFWHYPHYHAGGDSPYGAVRAGRWRFVEFYEAMRVELYDLNKDPGESVDLAKKLPDKVNELRSMLHDWRISVGAQMPTSNPVYDKEKAQRTARGEKLSS